MSEFVDEVLSSSGIHSLSGGGRGTTREYKTKKIEGLRYLSHKISKCRLSKRAAK